MRIRYGKPIKVVSLVGKQNVLKHSGGGKIAHVCFINSNSFMFDSQLGPTSSAKKISIINEHKYFCFVKLTFTPTGTDRFIFYKGDGTANTDANSPNCYVDNYYHCSINTCNNTSNTTHLNFYLNTYQEVTGDVLFGGIIDLTEIGLDNLTAQQFYNKYNKYFPFIATGEEITIDDKAGQISISRLPSEYQEVEYIQSQGSQWIDTGYQISPNYNYSLEAKAQTTVDTYLNFFATFGYENTTGGLLGFGSSNSYNNFCAFFYAISGMQSNVARDLDAHIYKARYNKLVSNTLYLEVDNTGEVSYSNSDFNTYSYSTNNLTLLGVPQANTGFHKNKLYYFKLWDSENLVHNFIPCYNKYTNDIGLFDLCSSRKNLCFRQTVSKYNYSYDYLKYNANNAIYLEAGTYTLSFTSLNGVYIQAFAPNDTSTNVLVTTAFSNCSVPGGSVGNVWNNKGLNVSSNGPLTFTLTDNYIITICGRDSSESYTVTNIQIEKGTTATTYEHSAFYINAGTGTFLKGNNVNNTISCKVAGGSSDIYYGYNQLGNTDYKLYNNNNGTITLDDYGCTLTKSTDGAWANSTLIQVITNETQNAHKYLWFFKIKFNMTDVTDNQGFYFVQTSGITMITYQKPETILNDNEWHSYSGIITATKDSTDGRTFVYWKNNAGVAGLKAGDTISFKDYNCIDLTEWFGEGKEPSTVAEFKEKFTKEYYGFCPTPIKLTRYQIEALPSYGYNQLFNLTTASQSKYGITINYDKNTRVMHIYGTATSNYVNQGLSGCPSTQTIEGHKYYSTLGYKTDTFGPEIANNEFKIPYNQIFRYNGEVTERIWTETQTRTGHTFSFAIWSGNTVDFYFRPMLIDLTDWYGEGNEPTTIEEFKQTFPNLNYPYSKKRLLNKYQINKLIN